MNICFWAPKTKQGFFTKCIPVCLFFCLCTAMERQLFNKCYTNTRQTLATVDALGLQRRVYGDGQGGQGGRKPNIGSIITNYKVHFPIILNTNFENSRIHHAECKVVSSATVFFTLWLCSGTTARRCASSLFIV